MDVELQFGGERVVLEIPDDRVSTLWSPPVSGRSARSVRRFSTALEAPIDSRRFVRPSFRATGLCSLSVRGFRA